MSPNDRVTDLACRKLYRERPRSRFARGTVVALAALVVWAWIFGDFDASALFSERSSRNLDRFLGELRPHPLHDKAWDTGVVLATNASAGIALPSVNLLRYSLASATLF